MHTHTHTHNSQQRYFGFHVPLVLNTYIIDVQSANGEISPRLKDFYIYSGDQIDNSPLHSSYNN